MCIIYVFQGSLVVSFPWIHSVQAVAAQPAMQCLVLEDCVQCAEAAGQGGEQRCV